MSSEVVLFLQVQKQRPSLSPKTVEREGTEAPAACWWRLPNSVTAELVGTPACSKPLLGGVQEAGIKDRPSGDPDRGQSVSAQESAQFSTVMRVCAELRLVKQN